MATKKVNTTDEIKLLQVELEDKLSNYCGVTPKDASTEQMYKAVSLTILDKLLAKKKEFNHQAKVKSAKRVY